VTGRIDQRAATNTMCTRLNQWYTCCNQSSAAVAILRTQSTTSQQRLRSGWCGDVRCITCKA
jgi:hypothetical protein